MNQVLHRIKINKVILGIGLLLMAAATFSFFNNNLYSAELAYVERSNDPLVEGVVIPASCESNPVQDHFANDCQCSVTASACGGGMCDKTISWNTNFNWATWGRASLYKDGVLVNASVNNVGSAVHSIPLAGSTFRLRRPDGVTICSAFVAGLPPPTLTMSVSPTTINPGQSATISWSSGNATACTASNAWSGGKATGAHSEMVSPASNSSYTLVCQDAAGRLVSRTVNVTVNPPLVNLVASDYHIGPGDSTELSWTTVGATTCTASNDWTGAKAVNASEFVSPTVTSDYDLTCSGPSGVTTDSVQILMPSALLNATNCTIAAEASSCLSAVRWRSFNFIGTTSVRQNGTQFSTLGIRGYSPGWPIPATGPMSRAINPDNDLLTIKDTGSAFELSVTPVASCAAGSTWVTGSAPSRCVVIPTMTITSDPEIIRNGNTAEIGIAVTSNYNLTCTVRGGVPATSATFTHNGTVSASSTRTITSLPLEAAQIVEVYCEADLYPAVNATRDMRIRVTPRVEEI